MTTVSFLKIEDDLIFLKMKDNHDIFKNGRQTILFNWKTT